MSAKQTRDSIDDPYKDVVYSDESEDNVNDPYKDVVYSDESEDNVNDPYKDVVYSDESDQEINVKYVIYLFNQVLIYREFNNIGHHHLNYKFIEIIRLLGGSDRINALIMHFKWMKSKKIDAPQLGTFAKYAYSIPRKPLASPLPNKKF